MIILPYVKLGTMPYGCARVKSKRYLPSEKDIILIRENRIDKDIYNNPWICVRVDKIKGDNYFVSRI